MLDKDSFGKHDLFRTELIQAFTRANETKLEIYTSGSISISSTEHGYRSS